MPLSHELCNLLQLIQDNYCLVSNYLPKFHVYICKLMLYIIILPDSVSFILINQNWFNVHSLIIRLCSSFVTRPAALLFLLLRVYRFLIGYFGESVSTRPSPLHAETPPSFSSWLLRRTGRVTGALRLQRWTGVKKTMWSHFISRNSVSTIRTSRYLSGFTGLFIFVLSVKVSQLASSR